jgi:hypothetical protein
MAKLIIAVLAAFLLTHPARSAAADKSVGSAAKPASFVPHRKTNNHVYGSPIERPIVSHVKAAPHKATTKKRSPSPSHGAHAAANRQ